MRAVNLLPRDEPKKSFEASRGVVFGAVGGLALSTAVLVSMTVSAGGAAVSKQAELDGIRDQIAAIPVAPVEEKADDSALVAEKGARIGALSTALGDRVAWDRVLRNVSLVLPEDVWLTNLGAASGGNVSTSTGEVAKPTLTLTGSTYSQNGVARFLSRLSVVPELDNVRLQSSQTALASGRELVQFTLLADVRPPGAPASGSGS